MAMAARFMRNMSIEAAPLQSELMLFNATTKRFCLLNSSAAHVWNQLEQPRTAQELADALSDHFAAATREVVEADVRQVLDRLESLELVSRAS